LPGLAERFDHRSVCIRYQDRVGRLVLGDPRISFSSGELRLGRIQRGLRLLVALSGSPSVAHELGVSLFIRFGLNDGCAHCGNGVALCSDREAKVGFVDPHQRLTGFDLLTGIEKPFHDLAGNAKTEVALDSRPYDPREAAFGSGHPRCCHQPDDGGGLPRVAHGGGCRRVNGKRNERGHAEHGDQNAAQHNNGSLFHADRLV
jgi:hypothetical protein